jgi:hypothetical protein
MINVFAVPIRTVLGAIAALALVLAASAEVRPFPPSFHTEDIKRRLEAFHEEISPDARFGRTCIYASIEKGTKQPSKISGYPRVQR